jgi:hypothetical protein
MISCPVCEHSQASGEECEVCGKRFAPGPAGDGPIARVEGLEPTGFAASDGAVAEVAAMDGLEATAAAAVQVVLETTPDMEPTRSAPVEAVAERMADMEATAAEPIPGDAPTPALQSLVCRYCRTPSPLDAAICGRCGMQLPRVAAAAVTAAVAAPRDPTRCPACGTRNTGDLCTGCGVLLRYSAT